MSVRNTFMNDLNNLAAGVNKEFIRLKVDTRFTVEKRYGYKAIINHHQHTIRAGLTKKEVSQFLEACLIALQSVPVKS